MDRDAIETQKRALLAAFRFRHATKIFDPEKKIDEGDFGFIMEAARLAPSSFGLEPWNLVVLQDAKLREGLKPVAWGAQGQLETASHFVLILVRRARELQPDSAHVRHMLADIRGWPADKVAGMQEHFGAFLRDDFKIGSEDLFREWASRQAYIAMSSMITAAALIGIDSCPMEGFNRDRAEAALARLGVMDPERFSLSCMVAFGYRAVEPGIKTRRPLTEIVTWA